MSLKLSAGCQCCDTPPPPNTCSNCCSDSTVQTEFDATLTGLSDGTNCDICEDLTGVFTLDGISEKSEGTGWVDGWSGVTGAFGSWSRAADIPSGATHACVWNYTFPTVSGIYPNCQWNEDVGMFPPFDTILYSFTIYGYTLAKFRISASSFVWRFIVNYQMTVSCSSSFGDHDSSIYNDGWYWEITEITNDCSLNSSDSWTSTVPTFDLDVTCVHNTTANFADFCGGALSLTSVVDG